MAVADGTLEEHAGVLGPELPDLTARTVDGDAQAVLGGVNSSRASAKRSPSARTAARRFGSNANRSFVAYADHDAMYSGRDRPRAYSEIDAGFAKSAMT